MAKVVQDMQGSKVRSPSSCQLRNVDALVRTLVENLTDSQADYWSFRHARTRPCDYNLYQYPAMMVPEMQRVLMRAIVDFQGGAVRSLLDPFAGAGTALLEGMLLGLDVTGQDVNPLAVLLSQIKAGPYDIEATRKASNLVIFRALRDWSGPLATEFPGRSKWFRPETIRDLSSLHRAVRAEINPGLRRVLWATLAETVRLTSNARTSTYKLHIRPAEQVSGVDRQPIPVFARLAERNLQRLTAVEDLLTQEGQLVGGCYRNSFRFVIGDTAKEILPATNQEGYDLVVTSPPYGDNISTVSYGQASYLPLQWIDLRDIGDGTVGSECLRSTYEIDRRSLGGKPSINWDADIERLVLLSPSLRSVLDKLSSAPADRGRRIVSYARDLESAVRSISAGVRSHGYVLFTVGNRRVGGEEIPTTTIVSEFFSTLGVELVVAVQRPIISKRIASRNSVAPTMKSEAIMIFRKRGSE